MKDLYKSGKSNVSGNRVADPIIVQRNSRNVIRPTLYSGFKPNRFSTFPNTKGNAYRTPYGKISLFYLGEYQGRSDKTRIWFRKCS